MNQDKLVEQLTQGLERTRPALPGMGRLLLLSLAMGAALAALIGLRPDLLTIMQSQPFRLEILLLALLAIGGYALALRSAVPGLLQNPRLGFGVLAVEIFLLALLFLRHESLGFPEHFFAGAHCTFLITVSSTLPMIFALRSLRQGAPTYPRLSMAFALLGSFAVGIGFQQLICFSQDPWHLITWHLGILPASMLLSWVLGRRVLAW